MLLKLTIAKLGRLIQDQSKVKGGNKMTKAPKESSIQGAKKVIFTACNLGKLRLDILALTSFQLA